MFTRTYNYFVWIMATGLAFLGVLRALTIDNQLAVIKNDCYERLAIGQRHNSKDVYKTSHDITTVLECQLFCTKEKELCKSFSFGIGVKGNASCELSNDTIKETADLKPIGTKADTEYDLYIKKLGCTLVIDKNNPAFDQYKPQIKPEDTGYQSGGTFGSYPSKPLLKPVYEKPESATNYDKPSNSGNGRPPNSGYDTPPNSGYDKPSSSGYDKPLNSGYQKPSTSGYEKPSRPPVYGYNDLPTFYPTSTSKPDTPTYGKPQEETGHVQTMVSISTGPQKPVLHPVHEILVGQGLYNYARPPFRPPALNYPYDNPYRPRPDDYDSVPQRPDYDSRPGGSSLVPYGHRPIPEKYGSYIPRPDHYYRPDNDYYRPRPFDDYYNYRPRPPDDIYGQRPRPPSDGYNQRPLRPNSDYDRPNFPINNYDRPNPSSSNYDRPKPPSNNYDRPRPPSSNYDRPRPPSSNYDRPNPPISEYDKPRPPINNYDRPNPSISDYDRPKPPSSNYDRPDPPSSDYNRPRPPSMSYEKPKPPPSSSYDRPNPPSNNYDRPIPPPSSSYAKPSPTPSSNYDRPNPPSSNYDRPKPPSDSGYDRPKPPSDSDYDRPNPPSNYYDRPRPPSGSDYDRPNPPLDTYNSNRPFRPTNEYLFDKSIDRYDTQPEKPQQSVKPSDSSNNNYNSIKGTSKPKDPHSKPIITHSIGSHGESITSIITELDEGKQDACFLAIRF